MLRSASYFQLIVSLSYPRVPVTPHLPKSPSYASGVTPPPQKRAQHSSPSPQREDSIDGADQSTINTADPTSNLPDLDADTLLHEAAVTLDEFEDDRTGVGDIITIPCLLYTSPSPRD